MTRQRKRKPNKANTDWHIKYINDIESNGIECWWTIGEYNGLKRFYRIVPYRKCDARGVILETKPKYFAFYESTSWYDASAPNFQCANRLSYDGIIPENECLIAIYESLATAKRRVNTQLTHISNLIEFYIVAKNETALGATRPGNNGRPRGMI